MFTTTQVASAFEHCDEPSCSDYAGGIQKKSNDSKNDGAAMHCAVGCHHATVMPQQMVLALRTTMDVKRIWSERLMPESIVGEALIEPPSHV